MLNVPFGTVVEFSPSCSKLASSVEVSQQITYTQTPTMEILSTRTKLAKNCCCNTSYSEPFLGVDARACRIKAEELLVLGG